ncbi:hypothetical protein M413DRAFT_285114 [Hebeloma cylindrosporum]|uniref:Uncharacterized protein n=1 Tax=Hebeloma cylindrosporum TaxID=76867 RepID=A0A0C3BXN1_HEBCY|nr:hypothetical protein M413DRAFT_285114 [Hebeloma cylindrosporum h7]
MQPRIIWYSCPVHTRLDRSLEELNDEDVPIRSVELEEGGDFRDEDTSNSGGAYRNLRATCEPHVRRCSQVFAGGMQCSQVSAGSAQLGKRDGRSHMYLRYMYSGFADIMIHRPS